MTQLTRKQSGLRKPVAVLKIGVINPKFIEYVCGKHVFSQVLFYIQLDFVGSIAFPFHQSSIN